MTIEIANWRIVIAILGAVAASQRELEEMKPAVSEAVKPE
jgi:hypothetical protein